MLLFIKWNINKACKMNESDLKILKNKCYNCFPRWNFTVASQGEATFINFNMKIIACIILFKYTYILQYSCLENPMDRGAWETTVHGVAQSQKPLSNFISLSCIREGNGNLLQCSCLEIPRDSGAWWAAVSGVAQSRTQLKWLSSSSSKKFNNFWI